MKEAKEYAAGGVVERNGKVLLVKVANLSGEVVWTFPKGHLEKKETPLKAALREVEEETGWKCRSVGPLALVRYRFNRNGRPVAKKVRWYRMEPVEKTGRPDEVEIMKTKWVAKKTAAKRLSYPSDLRLIARYLNSPM
ncbi:MAG: NUDIX domain-containing protein [Elusimicrobia bacterium]|nr:NUDIX domain-containing protein [Elusimicrobiota bacterium]